MNGGNEVNRKRKVYQLSSVEIHAEFTVVLEKVRTRNFTVTQVTARYYITYGITIRRQKVNGA